MKAKSGGFVVFVALVLVELPGGRAFAQDLNWDGRFGFPVFSSPIAAMALDGDGKLFAGGQFSGAPGNHIAYWDGRHWLPLGAGSANGVPTNVNAVMRLGTNVFVGGNFSEINGQDAGFVARWDGTAFSPLGTGVNSNVYALATDGTNLYVGGSFTTAGGLNASNIAKWDGTHWQAMEDGLGNDAASVKSIITAPDGSIYAGGSFTNTGGLAVNHITRWDGMHWRPIGAGVDNTVLAVALNGTNVCIGGSFAHSGNGPAGGIAQWDGMQWSSIGGGVANGAIDTLASDGTNLFAGGTFTVAGGVAAANIAKWDGTNWSALSTGMNGAVNTLVLDGGVLYASGAFTSAGGVSASYIAQWNGQQWAAFNQPLNGGNPTQVNVVTVAGTNVYTGGYFSTAGGVAANNIACWNGARWASLGTGSANGLGVWPWAIAVSPSGDVYAGGAFTQAGEKPAYGIARWDGSHWLALGSGLDELKSGFNVAVYALAIDTNGDLYAGGKFTSIGGVPVQNIARWDGTNWYDVGGGLSGIGGAASVKALLLQGTNLFAGGEFSKIFSTSSYVPGIAVWTGSAWSPVGSGGLASASGAVEALTTDGANVYAAGVFGNIGGVNATNVARWDGTNWFALNAAIPRQNQVFSIAIYKNEVIIGGNFSSIGGQPFAGLARLIDNQWWPLGSGLGGSFPLVYSLAQTSNTLYVGGEFTQAGAQGANYFAAWNLGNELPAVQIISPTNQSVFNGYQTIAISAAAASANGPITNVQFFADGSLLNSTTNSPYFGAWSNLTSGAHVLGAAATDATGTSWTESVSVTVNLPTNGPIITQEPVSVVVSNGAAADLTIQAVGVGELTYQWFDDGVAIAGATDSSLLLTNAQLANSGVYTVQVGDSRGTNLSVRAPVSVLQNVVIAWNQPISPGPVITAPAIGSGGEAYVASGSELAAFGANGAFQWSTNTTNTELIFFETSVSIDSNNVLYAGESGGKFFSLNSDGSPRWSYETGGSISAAAAIGSDGTLYVGSADDHLYAFTSSGSNKWAFAAKQPIWAAPAIATNGSIYFCSQDSNVYALSPDGSNLWTFTADAPFYAYNSPIIAGDGTILVSTSGTNLYALNPDGTLKWKFGAVGPFYCSPVIGMDGTIYIGNAGASVPRGTHMPQGRLYAISPNGVENWEFTTSDTVRTSAAVAADGTIYFCCSDEFLYALNPDGTERWQALVGVSSPSIRFDGTVYCGGISAVLANSPLADSPWPMYQHDIRHSGNAATPAAPNGWHYPFESNEFGADGEFSLLLTDQLGRSYGLQASTDLVNWQRVFTFTNLGGASEYIDSSATNHAGRYYRVVVP